MNRWMSWLPALGWLTTYRKTDLPRDLVAGMLVTVMLVPQAVAYAVLAGLPPHTGLYAALLPLLVYALFGSSPNLSVGPVAVVSLMTAAALGSLELADEQVRIVAAAALALLVGVVLVVMAMLRLGLVVRFISHPVLNGFLSAAALLIILSQLPALLGLPPVQGEPYARVVAMAGQLDHVQPATLVVGLGSVVILLFLRRFGGAIITRLGLPAGVATMIVQLAPLIVLVLAALAGSFWLTGVAVVGTVPEGLPAMTLPMADMALWQQLLPLAVLIALVGFVESVSVSQALAARRRGRIEPDRELLGIGAANLAAGVSGGFPVAGGLARSALSFQAGAATPLAGVVTAVGIALVLLFFSPLLSWLPLSALAAVIVVAALALIDVRSMLSVWRFSRADGFCMLVTLASVLVLGIEIGIVTGVMLSLVLFVWRTSRPHIAVVGRVPGTEHFRNIQRHEVDTSRRVLAVRVDESLYFANTRWLEDRLLAEVAARADLEHLVLVCSAVNDIDASALETLTALAQALTDAGVTLHLAEVKGPVMDRLRRAGFEEALGEGRIFLSTHGAMTTLDPEAFGIQSD